MTQHQRLLDPQPGEQAAARPFEQPLQARAALTDVSLPAQDRDTWLDLLLPDKLPAETPLDAAESERVRAILSGLLEALNLDHAASLKKLDALIGDLAKPDSQPAEINTSGLPLTPFQASDYDRYFRVNRLETSEPAMAMARSLIQTVHAVTHLFDKGGDLPAIHIRRQLDGFISHTHLLARTFGLEPLQ